MEEKLKEINGLYEKVIECIKDREPSSAKDGAVLLSKVINAEVELFNKVYGSCGTIRSDVLAALMEAHLDAMKGAGVYRAESVTNVKRALGSVCMVVEKKE